MYDEQRARLSGAEPVKLLNPLGQDLAYLRTSLIPGMLESVARNINHGNPDLRLFEIGHVFSVDKTAKPKLVENFLEQEKVCLIVSGAIRPRSWDEATRNADLFDLKGDILALVGSRTLDKCSLIPYSTSDGLTDDALALEIHGTYAGYIGRLKKSVTQRQGIDADVYAGEFLLEKLLTDGARQYMPLPRFPKVKRDLAFVLAADVSVGSLEETLRRSTGALLESVELFDIYEGDPLPAGKKSVAFSITLLSREKTLTDAEVDACLSRVIADFGVAHGATLRSS
jgi:phenylalanyl-tRNA synthetase beta chain